MSQAGFSEAVTDEADIGYWFALRSSSVSSVKNLPPSAGVRSCESSKFTSIILGAENATARLAPDHAV